jgi:hypothetical protein
VFIVTPVAGSSRSTSGDLCLGETAKKFAQEVNDDKALGEIYIGGAAVARMTRHFSAAVPQRASVWKKSIEFSRG